MSVTNTNDYNDNTKKDTNGGAHEIRARREDEEKEPQPNEIIAFFLFLMYVGHTRTQEHKKRIPGIEVVSLMVGGCFVVVDAAAIAYKKNLHGDEKKRVGNSIELLLFLSLPLPLPLPCLAWHGVACMRDCCTGGAFYIF